DTPVHSMLHEACHLIVLPPERRAAVHTDATDSVAEEDATCYLLRRFRGATGFRPVEYLQQVRVAKAREALELTKQSIDRIAWLVGYGDPAAFRKVFQRITGLTPNLYRQRFGIAR